jgi:flagellar basal-body rod protein FlgG
MNQAFEIAGVGLASQQRALDVIANNIANLNTFGFKRSDVRFVELIASVRDGANPGANLGAFEALAGVGTRSRLMLGDQGEIERTGRSMDIAVEGAGFIEVMGARGQTLLWRGGTLTIGENGQLSTTDGLALRAAITAPVETEELRIEANGLVRARLAGSDDFTDIGQITLVTTDALDGIEPVDGGLYQAGDDVALREMSPGEDNAGVIVQGALERSNVEISDEMIRLMLVQRAYTANAQIVQAADQLMGIANNLKR